MVGTFQEFEYHCYEGEDSQDAVLWHHTHQTCLVVNELSLDEFDYDEVGAIYTVVFEDGLRHEVFEDELIPRSEWYRPDYCPTKERE